MPSNAPDQRLAMLCGEGPDGRQVRPSPRIGCIIGRAGNQGPWPLILITEWISGNHLIWALCAGLAKTGLDAEWTRTFNNHFRNQWAQIKATVNRTHPGTPRRLLDIPPPPVLQVTLTHTVGPKTESFTIWATQVGMRRDRGLVNFLSYVNSTAVARADRFVALLKDEVRTGIPRSRNLPGPELLLEQPFLPPPLVRRVSQLSTIHRGPAPPPPYRPSSPAPPDYTP